MAQEEGPFTSYNKQDEVPTLVGNWVEERALKDFTGVTRTMGASQKLMEEAARTGSPVRGDALQATHPRVIEHVQAQTHPADWRSTHRTAYQGPANAELLQAYKDVAKAGPRERMALEQMLREAADVPADLMATISGGAPVQWDTTTTYKGDFTQHDITGMTLGSKVMRDRDGRPAVRDPTFMSEAELMPKHWVDRKLGEAAKQAGALETTLLPSADVPVTIYSEAVAKKTYGGVFPGTTTLNTGSPFGKSTNFSKPMGEYSKIVIDE